MQPVAAEWHLESEACRAAIETWAVSLCCGTNIYFTMAIKDFVITFYFRFCDVTFWFLFYAVYNLLSLSFNLKPFIRAAVFESPNKCGR